MKKLLPSKLLNGKSIVALVIGAVIVIVLIYFGVANPLLKWLGIKKDTEEKKDEKDDKRAFEKEANEKRKKQTPTLSDGVLNDLADAIFQCLRFSSISDDKPEAVRLICRVGNDTDFAILKQKFGFRREAFFGFEQEPQSLTGFIASNLSSSQKSTINQNFGNKSMLTRV